MQEAWVQSHVWEDPTRQGTTKLVSHNYLAYALEPMGRNYWSLHVLEPVLHEKRSHCNEKPENRQLESSPYSPQLEKSLYSNKDPAQPKTNKIFKKYR